MDFHAELIRIRTGVSDSALAIAKDLEAGRASAPFQEKLTALALSSATLPVRAALLAPSAETLHGLISEIVGQDYNVCKVVVPSRLGYSEILLQERGFLLDTGAGAREFDDLPSFLQALQVNHALPASENSDAPLRLQLMGPAQLNGLCLLVPHNIDTLVRKPALLSALTDQADWILLVGSPQSKISGDQRQAVQLLLDHVTGLQHVMVRAEIPEGTPAPPPEEWWKGWKAPLSLGLVRQGTPLLGQRLALLTGPDSELRRYLVELRLHRQCQTTLLLMEEELAMAQRTLSNRHALGRDGLLPNQAPPDLRKASEALRSLLADENESLLRSLERDAKGLMAPDGDYSRQLRAAAESLSVEDIVRTPNDTVMKLTLGDHVSRRLGETLENLGRHRLAAELQQLREGLECSLRDAEAGLEKATGLRHRLSLELPEEEAVWMTLTVNARPEIRYRGEMPRTTLATRFASARQGAMGLMIFGTILGGVAVLTGDGASGGNSIRSVLTALMLPLIIVGFLWTYVSSRKKEAQIIAKEVEKLHDGILAELRRALQDLLREQHAALASAAQRALRSVQTQIEAGCEKVHGMRQREGEEHRRRQSDQQRNVETRLGRLKQYAQQLGPLQARLSEARKLHQQWLSSWIERFNQGKA